MNKFVFSALATSLVGATGFANDTEWPELDRELAALNNAPLSLEHHEGLHVSGWLIAAITSDDTPADTVNDDLGTGVNGARVNMSGSLGQNYSFMLGFDFFDTADLYAPGGNPVGSSGVGGITDAYVDVAIAEGLDLKMGIFNRQFLGSSHIQRNHTIFIGRSYLGAMYSARDAGVALSGSFNRLNWEVAAQNGHSGTNDDFAYSAHVNVQVIGSGNYAEGAMGAAEGTNLNVGFTFTDDASDTNANTDTQNGGDGTGSVVALGQSRDASQLAAYANLSTGGFSAWFELVDQDDDVTMAGFGATGGATPWSAGLAYLFGENYEVAFRYDDFDNGPTNTTRFNVGVNRYIDGHDLKWQLNFASGSDDTLTGLTENDVIALGLAAGF